VVRGGKTGARYRYLLSFFARKRRKGVLRGLFSGASLRGVPRRIRNRDQRKRKEILEGIALFKAFAKRGGRKKKKTSTVQPANGGRRCGKISCGGVHLLSLHRCEERRRRERKKGALSPRSCSTHKTSTPSSSLSSSSEGKKEEGDAEGVLRCSTPTRRVGEKKGTAFPKGIGIDFYPFPFRGKGKGRVALSIALLNGWRSSKKKHHSRGKGCALYDPVECRSHRRVREEKKREKGCCVFGGGGVKKGEGI